MVRVAAVTGERLTLRQHHTMKAARVLQQVGVAGLATVSHFLAVERAGVAVAAFPPDLGVRADAAQALGAGPGR